MPGPAQEMQPVFVSAPTPRNGVTLLQRLLNSSRQIIIYGENKHICELMPAVVHMANAVHRTSHAEKEETLRRFLTETTEFWSSGLWPDTKLYLDLSVEVFKSYFKLYDSCSRHYGFERWGIKHPFWSVGDFQNLYALLPKARFIYIYRNLYDVARSAKARKFVSAPQQYERLAKSWNAGVKQVVPMKAENLLVIEYEELVREPEEWIERIERHAGISSIDATVMSRKYNTFRGQSHLGYSENEYIAPQELTGEETAILERHAGEMLAAHGYGNRVAAEAAPV
jgi:hypothetical protein